MVEVLCALVPFQFWQCIPYVADNNDYDSDVLLWRPLLLDIGFSQVHRVAEGHARLLTHEQCVNATSKHAFATLNYSTMTCATLQPGPGDICFVRVRVVSYLNNFQHLICSHFLPPTWRSQSPVISHLGLLSRLSKTRRNGRWNSNYQLNIGRDSRRLVD